MKMQWVRTLIVLEGSIHSLASDISSCNWRNISSTIQPFVDYKYSNGFTGANDLKLLYTFGYQGVIKY